MLFCVCCGVVLRCLWWLFSSFAYRCAHVHMLCLFVFCALFGCVCVFVVSVCYCLFCVPCLLLFRCAWLFVAFCSFFFQTISLGETRWHHYSSCSSYRWKWQSKRIFVLRAHVFICSRCSLFCIWNAIWWFFWRQQSFIVSYVHAALGRPALLCSTCCGKRFLVAKVAWCCGWSLGLLIVCPNNFSRFPVEHHLMDGWFPLHLGPFPN